MLAPILAKSRPPVESPFVRLHVAARACGVSTSTIRRLCNSQLVECRRTPVGLHRLVSLEACCEVVGVIPPDNHAQENQGEDEQAGGLVCGYCRVSTASQRVAGALDRQRERVEAFIRANYPGERYVVLFEQASGTNSDRKKLGKLMDMALAGRVRRLVVEWPDRLSRGSYGIISRLLEKCGVEIVVTRTGERENDAKTQEEEVLHDALCAIYCVQAKAHGKRAGLKQTLIPPAGFKERVAQLRGAGLGREDIVDKIVAEGWKCQSTGKPLKLRSVRLVLDGLQENGPIVPTSIRSFIQRRCAVGAGKRERSAVLFDAYVEHCRSCKKPPLSRAKWAELFKLACPHVRFENGAEFTIVEGAALRSTRPA